MNEFQKTIEEGAVDWLNSLNWHDSVLYKVILARENSIDEVVFELALINDWEKQISERVLLTFSGCFLVNSQLNWGYKCMSDGEMIGGATSSQDGSMIVNVQEEWKKRSLPLLGEFHLDLATTSSQIDIVFSKVSIKVIGAPINHSAPGPLTIHKDN